MVSFIVGLFVGAVAILIVARFVPVVKAIVKSVVG